MCSVKVSRCLGNLDKEDDAEGICSEAFQLCEPHLLEPKGLGGFPFPRVCGKQNGAVVRLYPRKMV